MEPELFKPSGVREIEHTWITLSDGCRVAARVWLPEDAEERPVPAILEYLPYRKRDGTRVRDAKNHPFFASHGYASVRVDIRGTGDSDGLMHDEYLKQEQDDALEIIEWIAKQPWCSGSVGMIGISWGGFNGLQVAARQPEALKAIITICSTDDRYADDVHYKGGCLLSDNFSWASTMLAFNSRPPDPATVGNEWLDKWLERLKGATFWLEPWLEHQTRDAYWRHGSVKEEFSAIKIPVFAVGGWADAYTNAVPRLLAGLTGPKLGLIGPWGHTYPNMGVPGPAAGFLQEALRWWDQWLKGVDSGIMNEPLLRAWMQESAPPATSYADRPGRWVAETCWPSPHITETVMPLAPGVLLPPSEANGDRWSAPLRVSSPLSTGQEGGKWLPYSGMPDLPGDQRADDGGSLLFDSGPLSEPVEILGAAVVDLELSSDRPVAQVAVRLSDVAPDGAATRVSYGLLNLTHRDGHEEPALLVPGERYRVRVKLDDAAQRFPAGNRVRLAISTSYWPIAWPPPEPVVLSVHGGSLSLPVRAPRETDAAVSVAAPALIAEPPRTRELRPGKRERKVTRDLATGVTSVESVSDEGTVLLEEIDLAVSRAARERYTHFGSDPNAVSAEAHWEFAHSRGEWSTRTLTRTRLTSTPTHFVLEAELNAYHGKKHVYGNSWRKEILRQHV